MKRMIFFLGLLLAGCSHTYKGSSNVGGIGVETEQDKGVFNSKATVVRTATSDYDDCLAKYANYSAKVKYCEDWIEAGRPGQEPKEFLYGYGGYYR